MIKSKEEFMEKDIEKVKKFVENQTKNYEILSNISESVYFNGALDVLHAVKSFIEVIYEDGE